MSAAYRLAHVYLGIDLGGTNIKSGVVDDEGRALSSVSIQTDSELGPEVGLERLAEAGNRAVLASGVGWDRIAAVGLGSPGTMDLGQGLLLEPPNLHGWENLPIRRLLSERLKKPTVLQNDGNAAAYGEFWAGAGKGSHSLAMFTLGTGIGCGIVVDGRLIEGRHSHGAECGHIIIQMENGRQCSCGALATSKRMRRQPLWSNGPWRRSGLTISPVCFGRLTRWSSAAGQSPTPPKPETPWRDA